MAFVIGFIHFLLTNWEERTEEHSGSVLLETCKTSPPAGPPPIPSLRAGARNSIGAVAVACALAGTRSLDASPLPAWPPCSSNAIVPCRWRDFLYHRPRFLPCSAALFLARAFPYHCELLHHGCHLRSDSEFQLGVPLVCAHFFASVFYFSICKRRYRAPVAPGGLTQASAIRKVKPMKTVRQTRHARVLRRYIVPFVFAFCPALIMQAPDRAVHAFSTRPWLCSACSALLLVCRVTCSVRNQPILRVIAIVAGVAIMIPMSEAERHSLTQHQSYQLPVRVRRIRLPEACSRQEGQRNKSNRLSFTVSPHRPTIWR